MFEDWSRRYSTVAREETQSGATVQTISLRERVYCYPVILSISPSIGVYSRARALAPNFAINSQSL